MEERFLACNLGLVAVFCPGVSDWLAVAGDDEVGKRTFRRCFPDAATTGMELSLGNIAFLFLSFLFLLCFSSNVERSINTVW